MLWLDAQLSPHLALWITETFAIDAFSVSRLGLRDANDYEIFMSARDAGAIIITKDLDFVKLQERFGPPPKILWLTLGNTSNAHMRDVFTRHLDFALKTLIGGASLVEIQGDSKV